MKLKLTREGERQFPELRGKLARIVGVSRTHGCILVQFDGIKKRESWAPKWFKKSSMQQKENK